MLLHIIFRPLIKWTVEISEILLLRGAVGGSGGLLGSLRLLLLLLVLIKVEETRMQGAEARGARAETAEDKVRIKLLPLLHRIEHL